jgi:hypothetical protein
LHHWLRAAGSATYRAVCRYDRHLPCTQIERYVGAKWQAVAASERLRLGQHDALVWLALNNLLVEPTARAKYELDDFRCGAGAWGLGPGA